MVLLRTTQTTTYLQTSTYVHENNEFVTIVGLFSSDYYFSGLLHSANRHVVSSQRHRFVARHLRNNLRWRRRHLVKRRTMTFQFFPTHLIVI